MASSIHCQITGTFDRSFTIHVQVTEVDYRKADRAEQDAGVHAVAAESGHVKAGYAPPLRDFSSASAGMVKAVASAEALEGQLAQMHSYTPRLEAGDT